MRWNEACLLARVLIEELDRPGIERRQTHISTVFLLERDVYKLKKPVDLGFLDFRTLEQRRVACAAEVALNARLAPGVYQGVVPLTERDGTLVDWAVHMRRLPDARRADVLLESGALQAAELDAVASTLAGFHAACPVAPAQHADPRIVRFNVEENFEQTSERLAGGGDLLRGDQVRELVAWQTGFLRDHWTLFEQRAASGRVRDGHGDLRLDHVYLHVDAIARAPLVIDCIEFNERFRYGDVCADIAFLSMDLASRGRVDLAERFVARYARESHDYDLYALVDFYESYRAFVRAKVSLMMGDETEARRYLLLALSADRRALLAPSVVCVGGTIAAGKSTIAERLGDAMSAPVIDADRTRKAMLGVAPTAPLHATAWHGAYDPTFTALVYTELVRRADVVLASGRPVVLDASFRSGDLRAAARRLAQRRGVPFVFVECRAPREVCLQRLAERERAPSVSDGRRAIVDEFSRSWEPPAELPDAELIVLDTTLPVREAIHRLRRRVQTWPRGLVA